MNSDFGTKKDKLAHADYLQVLGLQMDIAKATWQGLTGRSWSGPMTESVDRVEKRLAECKHCAGTGFVALGGSYEAADQRCPECKGRGRKQ